MVEGRGQYQQARLARSTRTRRPLQQEAINGTTLHWILRIDLQTKIGKFSRNMKSYVFSFITLEVYRLLFYLIKILYPGEANRSFSQFRPF